MTSKRINRLDYEKRSLAALAEEYPVHEIAAAVKRFRASRSANRRARHNAGNLLAVWVAIEWKRDQLKPRRHTVKRACEFLAKEIKSISQTKETGVMTVSAPPAWSRLSAIYYDAEKQAKRNTLFRERLEKALARQRDTLWPDDELIPAILVGGPETSLWLTFSDRPNPRE